MIEFFNKNLELAISEIPIRYPNPRRPFDIILHGSGVYGIIVNRDVLQILESTDQALNKLYRLPFATQTC